MKTTVKYSNVKYTESTLEDGRKVVSCDLTAEIKFNNVKNGALIFSVPDIYSTVKRNISEDGNAIVYCSAKAVCSPDDVYDFEVGRRLAYTRAQKNAFIEAARIYAEAGRRFVCDIENTIENCISSSVSCDFHTFEIMYGDDAEQKFMEHRFKHVIDYCNREAQE